MEFRGTSRELFWDLESETDSGCMRLDVCRSSSVAGVNRPQGHGSLQVPRAVSATTGSNGADALEGVLQRNPACEKSRGRGFDVNRTGSAEHEPTTRTRESTCSQPVKSLVLTSAARPRLGVVMLRGSSSEPTVGPAVELEAGTGLTIGMEREEHYWDGLYVLKCQERHRSASGEHPYQSAAARGAR